MEVDPGSLAGIIPWKAGGDPRTLDLGTTPPTVDLGATPILGELLDNLTPYAPD